MLICLCEVWIMFVVSYVYVRTYVVFRVFPGSNASTIFFSDIDRCPFFLLHFFCFNFVLFTLTLILHSLLCGRG